jgi:hypothetical protein
MKFMATWSIPQDKWLPVLKKWVSMSPQERTNAGEGVRIVGRWFDTAARTGVGIFEPSDLPPCRGTSHSGTLHGNRSGSGSR